MKFIRAVISRLCLSLYSSSVTIPITHISAAGNTCCVLNYCSIAISEVKCEMCISAGRRYDISQSCLCVCMIAWCVVKLSATSECYVTHVATQQQISVCWRRFSTTLNTGGLSALCVHSVRYFYTYISRLLRLSCHIPHTAYGLNFRYRRRSAIFTIYPFLRFVLLV